MAELFSEEDVRKITASLRCPCTEQCPEHWNAFAEADYGANVVRAVLSALAEDGRLRLPDEIVMSAEQLDALPDESPELEALRERVAQRRQARLWQAVGWTGPPVYAGSPQDQDGSGVLPSDTPALAGGEIQWGLQYADGVAVVMSEAAARELGADVDRTVCRRAVGPWEPVSDPVSVLEEETRDDPGTS